MELEFWKYQGNGNDFVIVDQRDLEDLLTKEQIRKLCNRHFGIGADGLIGIHESKVSDFEMRYFNADGQLSSLCGNGGRCVALFAYINGIAPREMVFEAFDGVHKAVIDEELTKGKKYAVSLQMADISAVDRNDNFYFLDTGSPHYVEFVENLAGMDVFKEGRATRLSERFSPAGTNVNFVEIKNNRLYVRTYERGVEEETLSCGTGVTASAIAAFLETGKKDLLIHTSGGDFKVNFDEAAGSFTNVCLHGPAELIFKGWITI
ncbi:MAG: diaminopimelate epimerase [Bacteroidales bacterium]|nr:diaminopimelate epimerase [Bacteroidales bacterium]